ncbi:hypothetical protein ALQ65_00099 [Pseudomonas syringae pv. coriandricola]|uniref:Uncharacterized protein n=1 Tax=Pseudomonas syringae pv. coriandricola TaxID=264453 RepID=A0A0P9L182_9PSED|nr:Unknown protein sequence [Pseudomonas syringae pv. coriandricola]RMN09208.1 hypothetical protein ALQ65_00099 [Pseudomonas syringae pv. coriandricola]
MYVQRFFMSSKRNARSGNCQAGRLPLSDCQGLLPDQ